MLTRVYVDASEGKYVSTVQGHVAMLSRARQYSNTAAHMQQAYSGHACTRYGRRSAPRCMPCGRSMTAKQRVEECGSIPHHVLSRMRSTVSVMRYVHARHAAYPILCIQYTYTAIHACRDVCVCVYRILGYRDTECYVPFLRRKSVARSYFSQKYGGGGYTFSCYLYTKTPYLGWNNRYKINMK